MRVGQSINLFLMCFTRKGVVKSAIKYLFTVDSNFTILAFIFDQEDICNDIDL